MTGTSGKAKTVNVVRTKKSSMTNQIQLRLKRKSQPAKAAEEARLKAAEEKQAAERSKKKQLSVKRQPWLRCVQSSEPVKIMRLMRRLSSKDKNPEDAKHADKAEKPIRKTCQTHQKESATDKKRVKLVKQKKSVCVRWRQKHAVKLPKKLKTHT